MAENVTVARPYAQAVFSLAKDANSLQQWSQSLELLRTVMADSAMTAALDSPTMESERQVELVASVCGDKIDAAQKRFLEVLAENGRLTLIGDIADLFEVEKAKAEGYLEAQVISAESLTSDQEETIKTALKARLGREVTLNCSVDASLIGGAIVRAGDLVIDGSAVGKLNRLSAELLH